MQGSTTCCTLELVQLGETHTSGGWVLIAKGETQTAKVPTLFLCLQRREQASEFLTGKQQSLGSRRHRSTAPRMGPTPASSSETILASHSKLVPRQATRSLRHKDNHQPHYSVVVAKARKRRDHFKQDCREKESQKPHNNHTHPQFERKTSSRLCLDRKTHTQS